MLVSGTRGFGWIQGPMACTGQGICRLGLFDVFLRAQHMISDPLAVATVFDVCCVDER
jgi:hypothetical protein